MAEAPAIIVCMPIRALAHIYTRLDAHTHPRAQMYVLYARRRRTINNIYIGLMIERLSHITIQNIIHTKHIDIHLRFYFIYMF